MGIFDTLGTLVLGEDPRAGMLQKGLNQYKTETDESIRNLQNQATGKQSYTREALRQGLGANLSQQQALAASARPGQQAAAHRQAQQQSGLATSAMSGQAALARMKEQEQAQQMLANYLLGLRGQNLQGQMGLMQQPTQGERLVEMGQGAAAAAMMSDRNVKTDIKDASDDADALLDGLKAYSYNYKDAKHGKGKQLGVMAQDLESAGLGQAVMETPEGKAVHAGKLAGGLAAGLARLNQRVKELEED